MFRYYASNICLIVSNLFLIYQRSISWNARFYLEIWTHKMLRKNTTFRARTFGMHCNSVLLYNSDSHPKILRRLFPTFLQQCCSILQYIWHASWWHSTSRLPDEKSILADVFAEDGSSSHYNIHIVFINVLASKTANHNHETNHTNDVYNISGAM